MTILLGLAAFGSLGYIGYRYWYVPWAVARQMEIDARARAAAQGISFEQALAQLAGVGCQAYAAQYGVPPQASGDLCNAAAQIAIAGGKKLGVALGIGFSYAGAGVVKIGGTAYNAAEKVLGSGQDVALAVVNMPLSIAKESYDLVKKGASYLKFW